MELWFVAVLISLFMGACIFAFAVIVDRRQGRIPAADPSQIQWPVAADPSIVVERRA